MRSIVLLFVFLISIFGAVTGYAQAYYPGGYFYTVSEDAQPYFFQPSEFSPLQTGAFTEIGEGIANNPLAAINRNPANMNRLSTNGYAYLDVKTLPEEQVRSYFGCEVCFYDELAYLSLPNPITRKVQEPFLSLALFLNPLENERLHMGFTYQYLDMNESYYRQIGYPNGYFTLLMSDISLLNVQPQFFGEENYFNKKGHFPTLFTGYTFSDAFDVALKVSYNNYRGDGVLATDTFRELADPPTGQTLMFDQNRTADYSHWDLAAGMNLQLTPTLNAGATAGFLTGSFAQDGREQYLNYTLSGNQLDDYYDEYHQEGNQRSVRRSGFDREGHTYYLKAEFDWQPRENRSFRLLYQGTRSLQDLGYGYSANHFRVNERYTVFEGEEEFRLIEDERDVLAEAEGEHRLWRNTAGFFFTQAIGLGFELRTGLQVTWQDSRETLFEDFSNYYVEDILEQENGGELTERNRINLQDRNMEVTQRFQQIMSQVPLVVRRSFGAYLEAEAGVLATRQDIAREYDLFLDRESEYSDTDHPDGGIVQDQSSYSQSDYVPDLQTYFNGYGSLIFSPVDRLSLRITTFSDHRQLNTFTSTNALRFRFSAEISF